MTPRQTIDTAYAKLRVIKSELFKKVFEFGITGEPKGFDIKAEIFALRKRFAAFNAWLRKKAADDDEYKRAIFQKCFNSGVEGMFFFFDALLWTTDPRLGSEKNQKWVSYPRQEDYIRWRWERVENNEPGAVEKSRDVGATWIACGFDLWFWIGTNNGDILVGSYKEEYCDGPDAKAILPKMDIILDNLDSWIKPSGFNGKSPERIFKSIRNFNTNSNVNAEAMNANFGRGGRTRIAELDEFPAWGKAEMAKRSVGKNANVIFYVGTPAGNATTHAKLMRDPSMKKFIFHWSDHPEYQEGRYVCEPGCVIHQMGGKPHSKLYDHVCKSAYNNNPKDVASELDINRVAAGGTVFPADLIQKVIDALRENPEPFEYYKVDWVMPPNIETKNLDDPYALLRMKSKWGIKASVINNGPLRVWQPPFSCRDAKCLCKGTGLHTYVMGGDVGKGLPQGDFDSFPILDITTGRVVADYYGKADPMVTGEIVGRLAKWYKAWCAIERNDQGYVVNNVLDALGLFLHLGRSEDKRRNNVNSHMGIFVSSNRNALIMSYIYPALTTLAEDGYPRYYDPDIAFWEECTTFITSTQVKHGELAPDKTKMGAAYDSHDDKIWGRQHAIHGAMERYGRIIGYIEEDAINDALARRRKQLNPRTGNAVVALNR